MKISVLTLFPKCLTPKAQHFKKAIESKALEIEFYNIRDYSKDPTKMRRLFVWRRRRNGNDAQPVYDALKAADSGAKPIGIFIAQGHRFNQACQRFVQVAAFVLLCGHYEGLTKGLLIII